MGEVLYEFTLPLGKPEEAITLIIIKEELINVLELRQGDQKIRVPLLGYSPNFLAELINLQAMNFSSLHNLNAQFTPFIPNLQPPRNAGQNYQQSIQKKQTYGPRSSAPTQLLKDIPIPEAIAILKQKSPSPPQNVRVRTSSVQDMEEFIYAYKGGSEIYVQGEVKEFKRNNLFIDLKLFTETLKQMVTEKKVTERHKISQTGHSYTVYVVSARIKEQESEKTQTKEQTLSVIQPTGTDKDQVNFKEPNTQTNHQQEPSKEPTSGATLVSASQVKSVLTEFLDQLFYSFEDDELTLELFISEAQYQKIPREVAKAFYEKKLEEREKKYQKKGLKTN